MAETPNPVSQQLESFGQYRKGTLDYKFHMWFDRKDAYYWYCTIDLPFMCTTQNKFFCLYKSEHETEKGG